VNPPIDAHSRIQLVGHGRSSSDDPAAPADTIAMQSPADLTKRFKALLTNERRFTAPKKISLNACNSERYAAELTTALFRKGVKTAVSGRGIDFTIDETGHKVTLGPDPQSVGAYKTTYQPDEHGQPIATAGAAKRYAGKVTAVDPVTGRMMVSIPAAGMRTANTETIAVGKDAIHRFNPGDDVTLRRTERGPVIDLAEPPAKTPRMKKLP